MGLQLLLRDRADNIKVQIQAAFNQAFHYGAAV